MMTEVFTSVLVLLIMVHRQSHFLYMLKVRKKLLFSANYLYFAVTTDVPVPYLHLFLFDSNATSVIIAWEAFGVSDSANITVR